MLKDKNKNKNKNKKNMKEIERLIIGLVNEFEEDYGSDGVLDEFFPHQTLGEIIWEMYEYGMIPEDKIEKFLNDE